MAVNLKQDLRRLAGARNLNDQVFNELNGLIFGMTPGAEHRAVAVVGAALVEEALRLAISKHLAPSRPPDSDVQLFEDEHAPLQGLAARTRMAYALGIINDSLRSDLTYIRLIRIAFAHSPEHVSFAHPTVQKSLNQLQSLDFQAMSNDGDLKRISGNNFDAVRFAAACALYCGALRLHQTFWHPHRRLARALADATLHKSAQQSPAAIESSNGGLPQP